jgi:hypothetical protein
MMNEDYRPDGWIRYKWAVKFVMKLDIRLLNLDIIQKYIT